MYCEQCAELMKEVESLKARLSEVQSNSLLAAVQSLRDECEASSRLIPPALDRDGGARQAFKTVMERLDEIIAANATEHRT